jgi:hypothetical protein
MIKLPKTCLPLQWKYWSYLPFENEYTSYALLSGILGSKRLLFEMRLERGSDKIVPGLLFSSISILKEGATQIPFSFREWNFHSPNPLCQSGKTCGI